MTYHGSWSHGLHHQPSVTNAGGGHGNTREFHGRGSCHLSLCVETDVTNMQIILQTQYTDTHINRDVNNAKAINIQNTIVNFLLIQLKHSHKFQGKFMNSAFYIKCVCNTCTRIISEI